MRVKVWIFLGVMLQAAGAAAEVKMPAIFGDHMVLQQEQTIPVWGWASPGEKVTVILGKDKAKTKADAGGHWRVDLRPIGYASESVTMTVAGKNTITFMDVLIGDVWLASGQSNMEFTLRGPVAIEAGDKPMIRLFTVPRLTSAHPVDDLTLPPNSPVGRWVLCSPKMLATDGNLHGFSAVAYFFGRDIQKFTGRPVGLVLSSWGGSPAEAWVSFEGLKKDPSLQRFVDAHQKLLDGYDASMAAYPAQMAEWKVKHEEWVRVTSLKNAEIQREWQAVATAAKAAAQPPPPGPRGVVNEPQEPDPSGGHGHPTALYNGMIAPIMPYAIKGVIWYQGESNGGHGIEYRTLFPRMITDWRERWGEGNFPFLYVQLPNFREKWNLVREAQLMTLALTNTGMAVTIDVGGAENLHPGFKEPVGDRLALAAEHVAYGKDVVYSGPIYKSMKVEGGTIRLFFDHVGGGLTIGRTPVQGTDAVVQPADHLVTFTVAGEDEVFYPAEAHIDGNTVVVESAQVPQPVAVRYGWDPPPVCNFYNKEMLPASPFRTDDWTQLIRSKPCKRAL